MELAEEICKFESIIRQHNLQTINIKLIKERPKSGISTNYQLELRLVNLLDLFGALLDKMDI